MPVTHVCAVPGGIAHVQRFGALTRLVIFPLEHAEELHRQHADALDALARGDTTSIEALQVAHGNQVIGWQQTEMEVG